ncbi:MAG: ferritin family protein [Deltaproteobacteria bacterium]|nr:ferritin family protein [Deltaproteobacteria bacterium]
MDLSKFSKETLLLTAIKSEIDSRQTYLDTATKIKNALLKEKLSFLASEEEKHKDIIEGIYSEEFSGKKVSIPETSPVPLPEIKIIDEMMPITEIFSMAMDAEKAAHDFYMEMSKLYEENLRIKNTIEYIATMELGHYKLLEIEKQNMKKFEDFDVYSPMLHVGA